MKVLDRKTQMMDAGMVLFTDSESFGNAIGRVKTSMEEYGGHIYRKSEINPDELPESTGECDLFLDWSSIWRTRYISCHVESAGEKTKDGKKIPVYAASFKEGNRSTLLRGITMTLIMVITALSIVMAKGILSVIGAIILIGMFAYIWILPSHLSISTVRKIEKGLKDQVRDISAA